MLSFSSVEDVIIFKCRGCYHFYGVNVIICSVPVAQFSATSAKSEDGLHLGA
jgi:hypothetical protein